MKSNLENDTIGQIKKFLVKNKFDWELVFSIKDAVLAGGALRSYFDKTAVSDFDIYFKNSQQPNYEDIISIFKGCKVLFMCPEKELLSIKFLAKSCGICAFFGRYSPKPRQ